MTVKQNLRITTSNKETIFHIVWLFVVMSVVRGTSEMSSEMDSDMGGTLSLGLGGGEGGSLGDLGVVQPVAGNNTVTAVQPGDAARLACPIPAEMYGTKVSWIRRGDLQLLAVGEDTYAHDHRFFVSHSRHSHSSHHSQVWFLHLLNVTKRDEGEYECQTSTHPHVSLVTFLKVQNAYSRVEGPEERVIASGSGLRLVCTIEGASSPPSYVFWYHYEKMVNYDKSRGISVTQTAPMRSTLVIAEVTADHAGNYTCQPSNAAPASVNVHVVAETTEPSATGRVGKKIAEKTPVRQLGVMSASSGGSSHLTASAPLVLLSFLLCQAFLVTNIVTFPVHIISFESLRSQKKISISRIPMYPWILRFLATLGIGDAKSIPINNKQDNLVVGTAVSFGLPK